MELLGGKVNRQSRRNHKPEKTWVVVSDSKTLYG